MTDLKEIANNWANEMQLMQSNQQYLIQKGMEAAFRQCLKLVEIQGMTMTDMAKNLNELIEQTKKNQNG